MFSFIETALFTRLVQEYLSDEEYGRLQQHLIENPDEGAVIRGGYRVIYFVRRTNDVIWMLTMYLKNVTDTIPAHILKQIREEIDDG